MGNVLLSKYQPIGKATYGAEDVELVKNISTGRVLALKTISKNDTDKYMWTANKRNLLITLSQQSIIRITDILDDDDNIYVVKDYIEGDSIAKRIENGEIFSWRTSLEWFVQLCEALRVLHKSKREMNIVAFNTDELIIGQGDIIKALNIGYAPDYKGQGIESAFVAPEVYESGEASNSADIYSMGVCLYHLLTGDKPEGRNFEFKSVRESNPKIPEGLEYILMKCLAKDPANRYNAATEILKDIANMDKLGESYAKGQKSLIIRTVIIVGIALACTLIGFLVYNKAETSKMSKYRVLVERAYHLFEEEHDYEEANQLFREAINVYDGVDAHIGVARVMMAQGAYEKCEAYLNGINQSHGARNTSEYNYIRGMLLYNSKEYTDAVLYLERAVTIDSDNLDYKTQLGICYAKSNNYIKADQLRKDITAIAGKNDWHTVMLDAYIKILQKNKDEGEQELLEIVDKVDEVGIVQQIYLEVSEIYENCEEDTEEAQRYADILESFYAKYPGSANTDLLIAMGNAYFKTGRYAESISYYDYAIDSGRNDYSTYILLAKACVKSGLYIDAEKNLNEVIVRFPDYKYLAYVELSYMEIAKQAEKPADERNYSVMIGFYNNATKSAPDGARTAEVVPLANELKRMTTQGLITP